MRIHPATPDGHEDQESRKILEGIALGERAFAEGNVISHEEAQLRLKRWLTEPQSFGENASFTESAIDEHEPRDR